MTQNSQPSNSPSFLKRVQRRLGLDSQQRPYFFYMPNTKSAKGSLIALAGVFMIVVAFMIPTTMTLVQNIRRNTLQAQEYVAGAQNAAKAGLEDTLGYFVRQNKLLTSYAGQVTEGQTPTWATGVSYVDQPFNPFYNTSNAAYSDTFQGTTVNLAGGITHAFFGICNEYPLDASTNTLIAAGQTTSVYFARYEVGEQANTITNGGIMTPLAVHDISGTRTTNYLNGDGLTWAINSTGYIYERKDYTVDDYGEYLVPYNTFPNKVVATARAYTEFRKLSCTLPNSAAGDAAIYATAATCVHVTYPSDVGGSMASGYGFCAMTGSSASATMPSGGGTTSVFGACTVLYPGTSESEGSTSNAPISDVNVFGMSLKDIQFIADYVGSASIPMTIQSNYKLSYFNGNLTYGPTQAQTIYQQLNTTGILCVNGNLTLQSPGENSGGTAFITNSNFSGIIFCTGNMTIQAGSIVDGVVIMGYSAASANNTPPQLSIQGASGNFTWLTADPTGVTHVIQEVATYHEDISSRRVLLAFPGI